MPSGRPGRWYSVASQRCASTSAGSVRKRISGIAVEIRSGSWYSAVTVEGASDSEPTRHGVILCGTASLCGRSQADSKTSGPQCARGCRRASGCGVRPGQGAVDRGPWASRPRPGPQRIGFAVGRQIATGLPRGSAGRCRQVADYDRSISGAASPCRRTAATVQYCVSSSSDPSFRLSGGRYLPFNGKHGSPRCSPYRQIPAGVAMLAVDGAPIAGLLSRRWSPPLDTIQTEQSGRGPSAASVSGL